MKAQTRYSPTRKLAELVHKQKSYRLHLHSLSQIMNKTNQPFLRRSSQLLELKSRKQQSYNHEQSEKGKHILMGNSLLYTKIYKSTLIKKENPNSSFQRLQLNIQHRDGQAQQNKKEVSLKEHYFVLRNHRQSPINKSTLLERTRENFRLANKIVKQEATYRTNEFQKLHEEAKSIKDRIMKYQIQSARTKAQIYVSHRLKFNGSSSGSISRKETPLNTPKNVIKYELKYFKKNQSNPEQNRQNFSHFLTQKPI